MKIAIVSDSHDNIPNIEKFLDWADKNSIKAIIHCGDLAAPSVIKKEFAPKFKGQVHFIHGNVADRELNKEVAKEFDHVTLHGDTGTLEIDGVKIAFNHFPWDAKKLAQTGKYDLVFYGHDHKPWEKTVGKTRMLNPGTLAGMFNKATFAVYDTKTGQAELILLEKI
ncbi:metallophosphoesterase family protein [Candidatus Falkowbacteria bacterium]|nr:metallophosphoesterase family protein [Candidatus Falkowbacteria bacterium]